MMNGNIQLMVILITLVQHVRNRERLLTEDEVAYLFGVDIQTVRKWRKEGLIGCVIFEGSIIRYKWEHVEARIESCERVARRLRAA